MSEGNTPEQELGVKLIACEISMNVMEIGKSDMVDGVGIGGVGSYLVEASEFRIKVFI